MVALRQLPTFLILLLLCDVAIAEDRSAVPGTVIAHSPASSGLYLGSPALAIMPEGIYLASHDIFGKLGEEGPETYVYRSTDRGTSWKKISTLRDQRWSSLHVLGDAIYMIGVSGTLFNAVIRKSTDGGVTWTEPSDPERGLLFRGDSSAACHCAPVPLLVHNGRVWRAMERFHPDAPWGNFWSFVMSAPLDGNLLDAGNWTFSNELFHPRTGIPGSTWLEGNLVLTPDNRLVNILRCHTETDNVACVLFVSDDGRTVGVNSEMQSIPLPGACKKFTIRYDDRSERYWSLTNYPLPRYRGINHVERTRNAVVLTSSADLKTWQIHKTILESEDVKRTGFQYIDWCVEGDDIVAISRTAYDDGVGGAHDCHDANFITFHRVRGFRSHLDDELGNGGG